MKKSFALVFVLFSVTTTLCRDLNEKELFVAREFLKSARSCNGDPDGVKEHLVYKNCPSTGDPIQVASMEILDAHNHTNYPINIKIPVILHAKSFNSGSTYSSLSVNVELYYHGTIFGFSCGWHTIPTGGALSNIDGCSFVPNCPLKPGTIILNQQVDLSHFSGIISILPKNPLKLVVHISDKSSGHEIACVQAEFVRAS